MQSWLTFNCEVCFSFNYYLTLWLLCIVLVLLLQTKTCKHQNQLHYTLKPILIWFWYNAAHGFDRLIFASSLNRPTPPPHDLANPCLRIFLIIWPLKQTFFCTTPVWKRFLTLTLATSAMAVGAGVQQVRAWVCGTHLDVYVATAIFPFHAMFPLRCGPRGTQVPATWGLAQIVHPCC